jgi:pimeloyl-ACP methyl ester carboxylesterase
MCNSNRGAWTAFAQAAAARGFHVMTLDYRGFGESEGQPFAPGPEQQQTIRDKWPGDVDAAFDFLVSRPGVDKTRIGAAGGSCGVNQAMQLARRHPDQVKTVVLLSGGVEPNAREYIRRTPSFPILAVASIDDGNIVQTMKWIESWSSNPASKYVEYKAAGHGTDMFAKESGLQPMMLEWFDAHVARSTPTTSPAPQTAVNPTPTLAFWTALETGNVAKAREIYDAEKKKDKTVVLFPEGELNLFGYQVLQEGRPKDAIVVFKMNVDEYPASANVYDSLSDAYLADGNNAEALRYAEKTIEVLDKDTQTPPEFKKLVADSANSKIAKLKK